MSDKQRVARDSKYSIAPASPGLDRRGSGLVNFLTLKKKSPSSLSLQTSESAAAAAAQAADAALLQTSLTSTGLSSSSSGSTTASAEGKLTIFLTGCLRLPQKPSSVGRAGGDAAKSRVVYCTLYFQDQRIKTNELTCGPNGDGTWATSIYFCVPPSQSSDLQLVVKVFEPDAESGKSEFLGETIVRPKVTDGKRTKKEDFPLHNHLPTEEDSRSGADSGQGSLSLEFLYEESGSAQDVMTEEIDGVIQVHVEEGTYKTLAVNTSTTVREIIAVMLVKFFHVTESESSEGNYTLLELASGGGERLMQRNERPLAIKLKSPDVQFHLLRPNRRTSSFSKMSSASLKSHAHARAKHKSLSAFKSGKDISDKISAPIAAPSNPFSSDKLLQVTEAARRELTKKLEELQKLYDEEAVTRKGLEEEQVSMRSGVVEAKAIVAAQQVELSVRDSRIAELQAVLNAKDSEIRSLASQVTDTQQQLKSAEQSHTERIERETKRVTEISASAADASSRIVQLERDVAAARLDVEAEKKRCADALADAALAKGNVEALQAELETRLREHAKTRTDIEQRLAARDREIAGFKAKAQEAQDALGLRARAAKSLEAEVDVACTQRDAAQASVQKLTEEVSALRRSAEARGLRRHSLRIASRHYRRKWKQRRHRRLRKTIARLVNFALHWRKRRQKRRRRWRLRALCVHSTRLLPRSVMS
eukprot:Opistho-2@71304